MKKIPIWKNVALIVAVLFMFMVATLAWFYKGPRSTISDMTVSVGRATYVQVSGGGGGLWKEDLTLPISLDRKFKEISGDGTNLYAPVYADAETEVGSGVYVKTLAKFKPVDTDCYYEQILKFRSNELEELFLSPTSYVKSYEAFQGDYISGAVRVAFFELDKEGNETLRYIWAPNSKTEYSAETESFTEEGSVEPYYFYQRSTRYQATADLTSSSVNVLAISTESSDENGCGYNATYKYLWSNGKNLPKNAPYVLKFTESDLDAKDELYYKSIKVKIWIEGHDRECVSLLSGEKFIVMLEFTTPEGEHYE